MSKSEYELMTVIGQILGRMDHPFRERLNECLNNVAEEFARTLRLEITPRYWSGKDVKETEIG